MGFLEHLPEGAAVPLAARHTVGRSRKCQLQIDEPAVSALHAELTWDGKVWRLRDLGSRNGTFLAGRRLPPGQVVQLEIGAEISFGEAARRYRFADASPPRLMAFGPDSFVVAEDGLLCLPSIGECEAMAFRDAGGRWMLETAGGTRPLADEECVVAGGVPWDIHLPVGGVATRDAEQGRDAIAEEEDALELAVSRDGEHVDVRIHRGAKVVTLESRAHAFLLVTLARARLEDVGQDHLAESEHGWMHRDDVMKALAIDSPRLNLWVYRARQQLAQAELRSAAQVIERREAAGQLRMGLRRVRLIEA